MTLAIRQVDDFGGFVQVHYAVVRMNAIEKIIILIDIADKSVILQHFNGNSVPVTGGDQGMVFREANLRTEAGKQLKIQLFPKNSG